MKRELLTLIIAAATSMGVSAASATSAGHRHDHANRHVSRAHHLAVRPGFAFAPPAAWSTYGRCVLDEGQGRFRSCSHSGN